MTREQAETFYAVHKARPFFGELVDFMISGPWSFKFSRAKTPCSNIATSWARPIPPRRPRNDPQAAREVDR